MFWVVGDARAEGGKDKDVRPDALWTASLQFAAARSSITLIVLLFVLALTFAMLGAFYYTGNKSFETAGGALGIITGLIAYVSLGCFSSR